MTKRNNVALPSGVFLSGSSVWFHDEYDIPRYSQAVKKFSEYRGISYLLSEENFENRKLPPRFALFSLFRVPVIARLTTTTKEEPVYFPFPEATKRVETEDDGRNAELSQLSRAVGEVLRQHENRAAVGSQHKGQKNPIADQRGSEHHTQAEEPVHEDRVSDGGREKHCGAAPRRRTGRHGIGKATAHS